MSSRTILYFRFMGTRTEVLDVQIFKLICEYVAFYCLNLFNALLILTILEKLVKHRLQRFLHYGRNDGSKLSLSASTHQNTIVSFRQAQCDSLNKLFLSYSLKLRPVFPFRISTLVTQTITHIK